jgi:hypothetical protein
VARIATPYFLRCCSNFCAIGIALVARRRVAIANSRLIACDHASVTFRWKDYRAEGRERQKVMTLATAEFIRRFLLPPRVDTSRNMVTARHRPDWFPARSLNLDQGSASFRP